MTNFKRNLKFHLHSMMWNMIVLNARKNIMHQILTKILSPVVNTRFAHRLILRKVNISVTL